MNAVIIVDNGVQDEEYLYPYYRLQEAFYHVDVAAATKNQLYGKYGIPIRTTMSTSELQATKFDLAIIPGGWESPEKVRQDSSVLKFLQEMNKPSKVIAAICHGPQVLISAHITSGRNMTCYQGIKDDLINADANYIEADLVLDTTHDKAVFITAPHYRNNPDFMRTILEQVNYINLVL